MQISQHSARTLLLVYLMPQWRRVLCLFMLLLSGIGLSVINPQLLRAFIDRVPTATTPTLLGIGLLFLGTALVTQLVTVAKTYLTADVGMTATNQLRTDLTAHCLQQDPAFYQLHSPGELIQRIDGDVASLNNFFAEFILQLLGNALMLFVILILSFRIDERLGLVLASCALLALFLLYRLRNVAVPAQQAVRQADAKLFGFLEERLAGLEDLRTSGAIAYTLRQFLPYAHNLLQTGRRAGLIGVAAFGTTGLWLTLGTALSLALSIYLFQQGEITIGTVYLIFAYTEMLRQPIFEMSYQLADLQKARAGLLRIQALFGYHRAVVDGPGVDFSTDAPAVTFAQVSFGYQADNLVLHDLSFELPAGQTLGLLGRTGSGKTTLTRLLWHLYDPMTGTIQLGGHDLREFRLTDLRARIGLGPQETQLFHASIRDNLTLFDTSIADEQIEQAVQQVGLAEWLRRQPAGLATKIAPSSIDLSGGEAQLLTLARLFLRNSSLIILDEASSHLDAATEQCLAQAMDHLLQDRTAIIIAHRLSTIQRVDRIMLLENGRICEYGGRQALANDPNSRFAQLLRTGLAEVLT